jgi:hypothetical protein
MFALHADLVNGNVFLPRCLCLGLLLFVFLCSLFFLLFYFVFCCRFIDSLVQNPLLMSDLFSVHVDLMKVDFFLCFCCCLRSIFFPLLFLATGSTLAAGLGFLLLVFLFFLFLLFYFIFCCCLVDSLVRNPLPMLNLFCLHTDLIKGDLFFFVFLLLHSFILVFSFTLSCCRFYSYRRFRVPRF